MTSSATGRSAAVRFIHPADQHACQTAECPMFGAPIGDRKI
ncbi:hypothetical protein [Jiella pacifica]|nr:hypothetical protein [Jiella pacifica]